MIGTQEDSHELLNVLLGGIFDEIQTFIVSKLKKPFIVPKIKQ